MFERVSGLFCNTKITHFVRSTHFVILNYPFVIKIGTHFVIKIGTHFVIIYIEVMFNLLLSAISF